MSTPGSRNFRIGHEEREQAVRALNDHFAAGRLDMHKYEERVGQASAARTAGELDALFTDLPTAASTQVTVQHPTAPYPAAPHPAAQQAGWDPNAPWGRDPVTGWPCSDKSKVVAGVLQLFLGAVGAGRFYTGHTGMAVAQLLVTLFTFGIGAIWGFVDGIVLLAGSPRDPYGRPLRS
ncbi:DUF1707 domain-containing protein [Pseudonocardia asaccharolytica]|uniref:DUF1707 domain-containing protein n=1 Tax=Pseudonocardia asaccharolytica TaxID=54010 RepID=UPI000491E81E|nr:DUF1707 domain-containing protein [Pseudonocardia asaccharolytica]